MKNLFNSIKLTKPGKNFFDMTHDVKLSCNMGDLVPTMLMECVPGDKVNIGCESLLRFMPLVSPVMHRFDVTMHYFFCPTRLVWNQWEDFITNGGDDVSPVVPAVPSYLIDNSNYTKLCDYLGLPTPTVAGTELVSAVPFAMYQLIWNEYYRDQNLQPRTNEQLVAGVNSNSDLLAMRKRAWEHDYFTSALPFAQKGAAVSIPTSFDDVPVYIKVPGSDTTLTGTPSNIDVNANVKVGSIGPDETLFAQTSALPGAADINDLRRAERLQQWLEKAARGGSRYIENILSHFGVKSSDARLQRPEYITGTKSPVIISEVLNTTGTDDLPQGNMSGHGVSITQGKYGHYYCEEHGYIMGIMSIMPKTAYQNGIHKTWLRTDPFEYYWPEFANIGEQEVQNREVCAYQTAGSTPFGYVPRYAEYKFMNSRVAGQLKTTLANWHCGRIFDPSAPPTLGEAFVVCDPRNDIFAVTDPNEDKLVAHILHKVSAVRSMPKFGTPQL